jgi:dephospho-CoA kinase
MLTIGLTGSIGMGKTTTAVIFEKHGVAICDSDRIVHDLYQNDAVPLIGEAFPGTVLDGAISRPALAQYLQHNPQGFKQLEMIIHPLVRQKQEEFLANSLHAGYDFALLDIPLLFEIGAENRVDVTVVVSADALIQKERVMARPGMTKERFEMIIDRQMPDFEKRFKADFVIDSSKTLADVELQVLEILAKLKQRIQEA